MYLTVLLLLIASAICVKRKACEGCYMVENYCYNPTKITELDAPFGNNPVITKLGILISNNNDTVFYAFQPKFEDPEYYKLGYVNLDNMKNVISSGLVTGSQIYNFQTFDVDQQNKNVYVGGSNGLFILDNNNRPNFFSSGSDTIIHVLFNYNVYFVRYNENKIIEKQGTLFKIYEDYKTVQNFVIGGKNHMVFLNNSGLFLNPIRTKVHKRLSPNRFLRGLAVDRHGVIYAWWINDLYKVYINDDLHINDENNNSTLVKIADIPTIGGLTFDNDNNMIYTLGKQLYVLKRVNNTMCDYKEVTEKNNTQVTYL